MFERILAAMFDEAKLSPRLNYRPRGEEIDGSVWFQGRTVLIEAKWTSGPHPASSLYQFKGKVDGKLVGTLGLFISIGGFTKDSVDALVAGKELNVVLADGDDIRLIVENQISVTKALEQKLRAAGDAGTPFLQLSAPVGAPPQVEGQHVVIVEGRTDVRLLESVRRAYGVTTPIVFVPAAGPMNMVPVTRLMLEVTSSLAKLTVVTDADLQETQIVRLHADIYALASDFDLDPEAVKVVAVQPDIEVALGLADPEEGWPNRRELHKLSDDDLDKHIAQADVLGRAAQNASLATVLGAIGVE